MGSRDTRTEPLPFDKGNKPRRRAKGGAKPRQRVARGAKPKRQPPPDNDAKPIDWHHMDVTPQTTYAEIRAWLREHAADGAICPCCRLEAKVYKRKLNSSMAYVLLLMVGEMQLNGGAYMHVPSMLNRKRLKPKVAAALRGDYAKLKHWGFIEQEKRPRRVSGEDKGKRTLGNWRPTERGIAFVRGEIDAPSHAVLYGKRCLRLVEETRTTINGALGDKWNYVELMREHVV